MLDYLTFACMLEYLLHVHNHIATVGPVFRQKYCGNLQNCTLTNVKKICVHWISWRDSMHDPVSSKQKRMDEYVISCLLHPYKTQNLRTTFGIQEGKRHNTYPHVKPQWYIFKCMFFYKINNILQVYLRSRLNCRLVSQKHNTGQSTEDNDMHMIQALLITWASGLPANSCLRLWRRWGRQCWNCVQQSHSGFYEQNVHITSKIV